MTKTKKIQAKDYNSIVQKAELLGVRMIKGNFDVQPEALAVFINPDQNADVKNNFSWDVIYKTYDPEEGLLVGEIKWHASNKIGRKKLVKASCNFVIAFKGLFDCDKDCINLFFETVGRTAAYPYFRSFYAQGASNAQIYLPILPMLKPANPLQPNDRESI